MKPEEQNDSLQLITFGKYKGKPIEILQSDPEYCEWLMSQCWFVERYPQINTLIINNFAKAEDTPIHNALQARFIDNDFSMRFCESLYADIRNKRINSASLYMKEGVYPGNIDITCQGFEIKGWDVAIGGNLVTERPNRINRELFCSFIEIKPEVGDDYPSILRQMKTNKMNCSWSDVTDQIRREDIDKHIDYRFVLVYDKFSAVGVNTDQMAKIFSMSGFHVLSFAEIEGIRITDLPFN